MGFGGSSWIFLGSLLGFLGGFLVIFGISLCFWGVSLWFFGISSWIFRVSSHFFGFFSHLSTPHFPPLPSTLPLHPCPPRNPHGPTGLEFPVIHQIVALDQIPGQAKNRPPRCHLHVPNLRPPGHYIQGSKGWDPHPLQPEFLGFWDLLPPRSGILGF